MSLASCDVDRCIEVDTPTEARIRPVKEDLWSLPRSKLMGRITSEDVEPYRREAQRLRQAVDALLRAERTCRRSISAGQNVCRYARIVSWCRSFSEWAVPTTILAPFICGAIAFVIALEIHATLPFALLLPIVSSSFGLVACLHVFFLPNKEWFNERLQRIDDDRASARRRLVATIPRRRSMEQKWTRADKKFRYLNGVVLSRQNLLLTTSWEDLRDTEFEEFLRDVFVMLGYAVEMTPPTGDHGVDLIVSRGGHRCAVQAKGWAANVGNQSIRDVYFGKCYYQCGSCAVITNSGFTRKAIEAAEPVDCMLVDRASIDMLIRSDRKLW